VRDEGREPATENSDMPMSLNEQAAGLKNPAEPVRKEVTAARKDHGADGDPVGDRIAIDFTHLKRQLSMAQVVDHLGLRLCGKGPQRRGPCPIHRGDGRGRTFSVHLEQNVFHCFDATCQKKGDVIDLWASVNGMSLRQAALDLVRTFNLEPAPGTEKRNG